MKQTNNNKPATNNEETRQSELSTHGFREIVLEIDNGGLPVIQEDPNGDSSENSSGSELSDDVEMSAPPENLSLRPLYLNDEMEDDAEGIEEEYDDGLEEHGNEEIVYSNSDATNSNVREEDEDESYECDECHNCFNHKIDLHEYITLLY